jgi:hypothetical protein
LVQLTENVTDRLLATGISLLRRWFSDRQVLRELGRIRDQGLRRRGA